MQGKTDLDTDKADKVESATNGNLASLDGNGNLTDSGWKSDKTTTAVSGNPVSISGLKSNQLAINPIITFEPIQAGSGDPSPSNIRAISGYDKIEVLSAGRNIWGGDKFADDVVTKINSATKNTTNKTVSFGGVYASNVILFDKFIPNTQYTVMYRTESGYYMDMEIKYTDDTTLLLSTQGTGRYVSDSSKSIKQIEGVFQSEAMIYYDEVGVFVGDVSAEEFEQYNPYQNLQLTLGQTVYGGTLDVEKGILTVDRGIVDLGDYNYEKVHGGSYFRTKIDALKYTNPQNFGMCTCYQYRKYIEAELVNNNEITITSSYYSSSIYIIIRDDNYTDATAFKTSVEGQKLVYLITPFTIQLTPHEISLLKDYAYVSTNGTSISLSYHNGELASLGDVAQLGQTVNELGDYLSINTFGERISMESYTSSNKYTFPCDGYLRIYSATRNPIYYMISDSTGRDDANYAFTIGIENGEAVSGISIATFVKKGMTTWLHPNTPFSSGHFVMFHPIK